ncbi:MAG TPA: hypothetical protein VKU41_05180 [Polyangiaceae bacterium]|nr:hypothetical protein [Polyangiaceae bacterium]
MWPAVPAKHCKHCGKELDAHTRRMGGRHCRSAACLHREALAHTEQLKRGLSVSAIAAARVHLPLLRRPPTVVVWLEHYEPRMVDVTAEDRRDHRRYLESVVAEGTVIDRLRLASPTADDGAPQGAGLCGQCRGRCCAHGAGWHAFMDRTLLQQWQDKHPGSSPVEAAEAYLELLPERHVEGACLYQTAAGCAIPREHRAWICNGFACAPLQEVQRLASQDAQAAVVAVTFHRDVVERAAVIDADGVTPLDESALDLPKLEPTIGGR